MQRFSSFNKKCKWGSSIVQFASTLNGVGYFNWTIQIYRECYGCIVARKIIKPINWGYLFIERTADLVKYTLLFLYFLLYRTRMPLLKRDKLKCLHESTFSLNHKKKKILIIIIYLHKNIYKYLYTNKFEYSQIIIQIYQHTNTLKQNTLVNCWSHWYFPLCFSPCNVRCCWHFLLFFTRAIDIRLSKGFLFPFSQKVIIG